MGSGWKGTIAGPQGLSRIGRSGSNRDLDDAGVRVKGLAIAQRLLNKLPSTFANVRILEMATLSPSSASSEPPSSPHAVSGLTDAQFHSLADAVLRQVEQTLDQWLEEDVVDIDTRRTGGLLELLFPDRSHIVINTQPPLHEIWLASRAGGFHFRHVAGQWVDTRGSDSFQEVLSREASRQAGLSLTFA
jgi:CyaY protein